MTREKLVEVMESAIFDMLRPGQDGKAISEAALFAIEASGAVVVPKAGNVKALEAAAEAFHNTVQESGRTDWGGPIPIPNYRKAIRVAIQTYLKALAEDEAEGG